jgi:hypothetical protein
VEALAFPSDLSFLTGVVGVSALAPRRGLLPPGASGAGVSEPRLTLEGAMANAPLAETRSGCYRVSENMIDVSDETRARGGDFRRLV